MNSIEPTNSSESKDEKILVIPRNISGAFLAEWYNREPTVALHTMLQLLQLGYAPDQPQIRSSFGTLQTRSDLEQLWNLLGNSPTHSYGQLVFSTLLQFIQKFTSNGNLRLLWLDSFHSFQDLISDPVSDIMVELCSNNIILFHKEKHQYTEAKPEDNSLLETWKTISESLLRIHIATIKLQLVNNILAEERVHKTQLSPGSLHMTISNHTKPDQWKKFLEYCFQIFSPKSPQDNNADESSQKKRKTRTKSSSKRSKRKDSNPNSAAMEVESPPADPHSGKSPIDHALDSAKNTVMEVLENLSVLLIPQHEGFVQDICEAFATFENNDDRVWFLQNFVASPKTKLQLLDILLVRDFVSNQARLKRVKSGAHSPSEAKMLSTYWDLRPISMSKIEEGVSYRSNYIVLCVLLMEMLDCLGFDSFSENTKSQSAQKVKLLHSEILQLRNNPLFYTPEQVEMSIQKAEDLLEYVEFFTS